MQSNSLLLSFALITTAAFIQTVSTQSINGTACSIFGSWSCDSSNSLFQCTYATDASLYWRELWNCGNGLTCQVNGPNGFVGCALGTSSTTTATFSTSSTGTTTTTSTTTTTTTTPRTTTTTTSTTTTTTTIPIRTTTTTSTTTTTTTLRITTTSTTTTTTVPTTTTTTTIATSPVTCSFGAWRCDGSVLQQCGYLASGLEWRWISKCPVGQYCNANGPNGWAGCQLTPA
ncbi:UNVERIFIED_CONTAM: hypothetical protein HDU68_009932 [Siphonaria sp. JEL0065]|nr:hypothetical protein HDU68_009932 [Siphonaria sp. JEL0065]